MDLMTILQASLTYDEVAFFATPISSYRFFGLSVKIVEKHSFLTKEEVLHVIGEQSNENNEEDE